MSKSLNAIVIGLGSAGDVHPNVGLALTLQRRGHCVLFIGPAVFRQLAARVGLEFAAIGTEEEYYETIRNPDLWHPLRSFKLVANKLILPAVRPVYDLIAARHEPGHTVVTAPSTAGGARIAQESWACRWRRFTCSHLFCAARRIRCVTASPAFSGCCRAARCAGCISARQTR